MSESGPQRIQQTVGGILYGAEIEKPKFMIKRSAAKQTQMESFATMA